MNACAAPGSACRIANMIRTTMKPSFSSDPAS